MVNDKPNQKKKTIKNKQKINLISKYIVIIVCYILNWYPDNVCFFVCLIFLYMVTDTHQVGSFSYYNMSCQNTLHQQVYCQRQKCFSESRQSQGLSFTYYVQVSDF